jgi:hypothetical protein
MLSEQTRLKCEGYNFGGYNAICFSGFLRLILKVGAIRSSETSETPAEI